MLERKIYNDLLNWKNNESNKKSLIIKGARQVGKTFIIEKFCESNYKKYYYINFMENEEMNTIFDGGLDAENIVKQLSLIIPNFEIVENDTVVFFDEIQECPRAITALKFLTIAKKFDVIASGSLLGINYKEVPSYPVGYVEHLEMHSLDFEEFCWANGVNKNAIEILKSYYDKGEVVPDSSHKRMLDLFKEYIVVGGMPEVVNEFIRTHNFSNVLSIQNDILEEYKLDIAKYADGNNKAKIRDCFMSIPRQLAKDYKKFSYKLVSSGGRSSKYEGSLRWLCDANIINICYNLNNLELPLEGNSRKDAFKVYLRDTGLLMAMLESGSQKEIIDGNLGIYKGAIYENVIADLLTKKGINLYYFEKNSTLEVDFILRVDSQVVGMEVKSGDNTKSKSLKSLIENWHVGKGIRLFTKNIGVSNDGILCLPIYMVMFLKVD